MRRLEERWNRCLLVMGDFNDEPFDRSILRELDASSGVDRLEESLKVASGSNLPNPISYAKRTATLFNCMWPLTARPDAGTYHFPAGHPTFNVLDQFIVSRGLYYGHSGLKMARNPDGLTVSADAFVSSSMWTSAKTRRPKKFDFGVKNGTAWHNGDSRGTSDHFPITTSIETP